MKNHFSRTLCRVLSLFLSLVLLAVAVPISVIAQGEEPIIGQLTGTQVRVRSGPGTNFEPVKHNGDVIYLDAPFRVTVLSEPIEGGAYQWYKVSFTYEETPYTDCYIAKDYIEILPTGTEPPEPPPVVENLNFEEQLAAFPESYKEALRALHALHPSWNFEAVDTGVDWNTIQNLENRLGYSLIQSPYASYYSTAPGSYDWSTDTYYALEGRTWFQAAPGVVAYYMDPRNFLTDSELFQFEKLAFSEASQTVQAIDAMLTGTFMKDKTLKNPEGADISYAQALLEIGREYNVSAFHLIIRCIQEVGWDGNACTNGTYEGYEGYYNFFNIGANTGATAGMAYAKNHGWDTPYKAIAGGAQVIGNGYIAIGQNTPYFQKFNVVAGTIGSHQYMTNVQAPSSEGRNQKNKYSSLGFLESSFTFRIPVYENMPATPCPKPVETGSPNNYLNSLSVDGYALTPSFDFYECLNNGVNSYTVIIRENISSIQVRALPASAYALVTGSVGTVNLQSGENNLTITVTAPNGEVRNYTLRVILQGGGSGGDPTPPTPPNPPEPIPSGWNPPFRIQGSTVSGFAVGTDVNAVLSSLGLYGSAAAVIKDENGSVVSAGAVRTGLVLEYYDGTNTTSFQMVLFGDLNGDAGVDAIDLLLVRKNLLGLAPLNGAAASSADVNHDGVVDAIDLLLVRKHLLGLYTITQ